MALASSVSDSGECACCGGSSSSCFGVCQFIVVNFPGAPLPSTLTWVFIPTPGGETVAAACDNNPACLCPFPDFQPEFVGQLAFCACGGSVCSEG